ncbi:hypothetical protein PGT21_000255 [Puccinia graminis f. sp. tritici]|uniref:Uncharacterized protein n=3 Tax=Puccinia graminis f. sp. tritici TaxID=56615 RepID=A0A5B0N0T9_PUCGR|nr:hypothetical protein PGT21_000255 [Puccinia graminis f. sp. tritici]
MSFQLPSTPAEWNELNQRVHRFSDSSVSRSAQSIIWLVTIVGPVPGILYLISALKKCHTNGWWLVKADDRGYLYPHNRVMLALWMVAFTLVNLAHSISLLFDCRSHLHPRTLIFHLVSFSLLSCFGWAKVWSVFYAMPPSRYRLAPVNQKSGPSHPLQSMKHPIPAYLFNPLIIIAHLVSLCGTLPWLVIAIKESYELLSAWDQYQSSYATMVGSSSTQILKFESQLQALLSLKKMIQSVETVQKNVKNVCTLLLVITLVQLIALVWCSYRILGALYFQAGVLRKAASRQINLQYEPKQIEFGFCQPSDPSSLNKIASAPQALSRSGSMHSSAKTIFTLHWKDFLPSLERGNKVSAHVWRSEPFQRTQEQIVGDGIKDISAFYWKLRRYAMHTLWHIVLAALVKSSYIALCISLASGAFDGLTLSDFEVAVFQWVNITWNCGVGFLLGLFSCIDVFTPTPTLPREPDPWEGEVDLSEEILR